MELQIRYRPFGGTLLMATNLDAPIDGNQPNEAFVYPSAEQWYVSVVTHNIEGIDVFVGASVLDIHNEGSSWNLWLSEWLSDELIVELFRLIEAWDAQYEVEKEPGTSAHNMKLRYEASLSLA